METWRYNREGNTTTFSCSDLYAFKIIFLLIYYRSPNGLRPRGISDFVTNYS